MKLLKRLPLFLFAIFILIPLSPAYADAAPPLAPQLGGVVPFKFQVTQVQMVYERVEMNVQVDANPTTDSQARGGPSQVIINAYFVMHNRGDAEEKMQVIFPLESFTDCEQWGFYMVDPSSFQVLIDGTATAYETVTSDNPYSKACNPLKWAGFPVTFPVDEDVVLKVSYKMVGEWDVAYNSIEYILETGAGWKGPIGTADIVLRFPYTINEGGMSTILSGTTGGYQPFYHEIYWSYRNIEPTSKDNIEVTFVNPVNWQEIMQLNRMVKEDPSNVDAWVELGNLYDRTSRDETHGWIKFPEYFSKAGDTFLAGIAANPLSSELNAQFANLWLNYELCPYFSQIHIEPYIEKCVPRGLPYLNQALALDQNNTMAQGDLDELKRFLPDFVYSWPPTMEPTITYTPSITYTPTFTPTSTPTITATHTLYPTWTPSHTRTGSPPPTISPTPTPIPIPWTAQFTQGNRFGAPVLVLLALLALAGAGYVNWRSVRRK